MKVLHVISDENIGGAGILLLNLLSYFDRHEVESAVVLPKDSQLIPRIKKLGVRVLPVRASLSRFSFSAVMEISSFIRLLKIDIVHANASACARIAGKLCGIPVIHTRHCCFPLSPVWHIPIIRALGGACNRILSDRVIATAEAAAKNLEGLGIQSEKIKVIINGSRPIRTVDEVELEKLRFSLGVHSSDFVVGICARLEECKGHETFLQAARLVLDRCKDKRIHFLLIGEGTRRASLESLSQWLHLGDRVHFVGFVNDPAPYYRLMNVNVNCSVGTETSCLALSEGMSAGIPMIASSYGGNPSMVGEEGAGFLFPPNDSEALAGYICKIAENKELENTMKRKAFERYEARYTAKRMADEVASLYREVLTQKRSVRG